jgi:vacuolar protein sorting-associated protein 13A/C
MADACETVRFVDDTDLTLTFDSRATSFQQMTNVEIMTKSIVLRASYRDINLIMSIINKALERYGNSQRTRTAQENETNSISDKAIVKKLDLATTQTTPSGKIETQYVGNARVLMTKEQVNFSNSFKS